MEIYVKRFLLLIFVSVFFAVSVAGQESLNQLPNAGFEKTTGKVLRQWGKYSRGYTIDNTEFHSGKSSIKCTAKGDQKGMGVTYTIKYDKPDKRPVIISGWSKAIDVKAGGDYCIYLDIFYEDGKPWWAQKCNWNRGTHDWEFSTYTCHPQKPVKEIKVYVFLRQTTGTAWFDDVKLTRGKIGLYLKDVRTTSDYPRSKNGVYLNGVLTEKAKWECAFLDADGKTLGTKKGSGKKISWFWPGKDNTQAVKAKITAENKKGRKLETMLDIGQKQRRKNPVQKGYVVWTQDSMKKVYPTEYPKPPFIKPQAGISLAKNEREGLQISVTPADDISLKNVKLKVGKFTNENGEVFASELIKWHIVGYIRLSGTSNHPFAPNESDWYPDVLLPAHPFDVAGGRTQTLWLNFFASDDVKSGTYRGMVTVEPVDSAATDVDITVTVRNFSLPRSPRMKTAFALMDGFTKYMYGEITDEIRRSGIDIMLDHRLNPDDISRTEPPRIEDLLYARQRGMNAFNILNIVPKPKPGSKEHMVLRSGIDVYGTQFNKEFASRVDDYVAQLRKHGLTDMAYFYGFDECRKEFAGVIKQTMKFLKERYPDISTFTTAMYIYRKPNENPPDYNDFVDWYCPYTSTYSPELSDKLRRMGKQVWWYVCCVPKYPYANFASVDYPTIEGRLLSWMTYGYKVDGLLYWHVNYWGDRWGDNKIIDSKSTYIDWKSHCILNMTGDGTLVYPVREGFVSSIRLENIRDGIEDYDYLSLLEDLKGRDAAMRYYSQIVKSMKEYTREPAMVYQVRDRIADEIEAAMKQP